MWCGHQDYSGWVYSWRMVPYWWSGDVSASYLNVIRSNYCCRRHTMHGNMVFSRDSIFPTPQQSGCLLACSVNCISGHFRSIGHFGCLKFTFDSNSGHFRSIQNYFFWRPFWMSENHFRLHFWPFLINRPSWMSEIHFRWHFWPFRSIRILIIFLNVWQNGRRRPCWMSENNFRSHFLPFQIDTQLFCWQNGRRRPFWMGRHVNYRTRPRYLDE